MSGMISYRVHLFLGGWLVCHLLAASVLFSAEAGSRDFDAKQQSLMNRTRAYELRLQDMHEMAGLDPDRTFALLVSIIKDPEDNLPIKYEAAHQLFELNSIRAKTLFQDLLETREADPVARRIALEGLFDGKSGPWPEKFGKILADPGEDPAIRQYLLGRYARDSQDPSKLNRLREFASSKSETPGFRMNALFWLEDLQDNDFVNEQTHKILNDPKENVELRKNATLIAGRMAQKEKAKDSS